MDIADRLQTAVADRYEVARVLGEGGMATVVLARDLRHPRDVAIKVLRPEVAVSVGSDRFLREIDIAAALQHPHIVPLYDSGQAGGLLYYVMPFVEGETLRQRLQRGPMDVPEAIQIVREVASALSYAHARGVVHRDIKPDNILLSAGEAVVTDFGIARALAEAGGTRLTGAGVALGTPLYMSPEQAGGVLDVGAASDIYSLGCVLFEMLAGQPPFLGSAFESVLRQHQSAPVPRISDLRHAVPPEVERALECALAKDPADRFATPTAFVTALGTAPGASVPMRRRTRRRIAQAALVGVVAVAAVLIWQRPDPSLQADLVAVAPFDVLAPGLQDWHVWMMDALSHKLDGAGSLRTASQSVVLRRWHGRADAASADAMARHVGAGLVVYGSVAAFGRDSVRLLATLRDVRRERLVGAVDLRESADQMDRLTDSVTVGLLRELDRVRPIGAVRSGSLGSRSLPALKAFLRAEQFYRRAVWDSTAYYALRAVQLDSTFALARRRLGIALGWMDDAPSLPEGRRAGDFNRGLSPRDSLLVRAIQLSELERGVRADSVRLLRRARFGVLRDLARYYPEDPEVWFELGEFIHHRSAEIGVSRHREFEVWQRSIELDPGFAPSYFHAIRMALHVNDPELARRHAEAYLALDSAGARHDWQARGTRLLADLLARQRGWTEAFEARSRTENADPFIVLWENLVRWPDRAESAVRAVRLAQQRPSVMFDPDPAIFARYLAEGLAFRGHLRDAYALLPPEGHRRALLADLALFEAMPADSAREVFGRQLRDGQAWFAPAWWAAVRDTAALQTWILRADGLAGRDSSVLVRRRAEFARQAARAWLALSRGDSAGALRQFLALPDSLCTACAFERLARVRLLAAAGRNREAAALLQDDLLFANQDPLPSEVLWVLERARVSERLGDAAAARVAYRYVADAWREADAALRPLAAEARAAAERRP